MSIIICNTNEINRPTERMILIPLVEGYRCTNIEEKITIAIKQLDGVKIVSV